MSRGYRKKLFIMPENQKSVHAPNTHELPLRTKFTSKFTFQPGIYGDFPYNSTKYSVIFMESLALLSFLGYNKNNKTYKA